MSICDSVCSKSSSWMFGHSLQINSPYAFRPGLMRQAVVSFAHRQINWVGLLWKDA